MDHETAGKMRGMVRRCVIKNVQDGGETQTCAVEVADGVWRSDVEVLQSYGVATNPPVDGALGLVLAVGGDEGDLVMLPAGNPSKRMGGLSAGDVAIYNEYGDRVVVKAGGGIDIQASQSITLKVGGVTLTISAGGLAIEGGAVTHNGTDIGDTHKHSGIVPGPAQTGTPV